MKYNWLAIGMLSATLLGCTEGAAPAITAEGTGVARSNTSIADEFVALMFATENGTRIPRLLKYETPVRVALDPALGAYRSDLEVVLGEMRSKSGLDIALSEGPAQIRIEEVPAAALRRAYPTAACVVVPGVSSFSQFLRGDFPRWSRQQSLTRATVLIPGGSAPYIVRACLNEEIAQALGPVNDLYYVSDTVFNDDNVFNNLTDFDLLVLKILYSPELRSGMQEAAVRAQLPRLLARLNPAGNRGSAQTAQKDRRWQAVIETAMNTAVPRARRISAATRAIARARSLGDHRLIHSLIIYGRLTLREQPSLAAPAFQEAYTLAQNQLGPNNLRTSLATMHIAAIALEAGKFAEVITLTTPALATARRHNEPVIIAGIQGLRALAFLKLGQISLSEAARVDSLKQARYAFGNNAAQIATAQAQIEGLLPRQN